jgi:hypothetical protein
MSKKSISDIADQIESLGKSLPEPTHTSNNAPPREEYVEAINQIFALFRLNYHNQYYSAYPDAEQVKQVKKLWFESLNKYPVRILLQAAKSAIEKSEYLPTLSRMHEQCVTQLSESGLPDSHTAYLQACQAPSPKASQSWSHPIVYLAGRDAGWFILANEPEAKAFKAFEQYYHKYLERVLQGETFEVPALPAPETQAPEPLDKEIQLELLAKLKAQTQL